MDVAVFRRRRTQKPAVWAHVLSRFYEIYKMPFTGLGTHHKKLKERPDEVKRMLKAMIRTNRFIRQNREGTIQTMVEWMKIDRDARRRPTIRPRGCSATTARSQKRA